MNRFGIPSARTQEDRNMSMDYSIMNKKPCTFTASRSICTIVFILAGSAGSAGSAGTAGTANGHRQLPVTALDFMEHEYTSVDVFGISISSLSGSLNKIRSAKDFKNHAEFRINSTELVYIARVLALLHSVPRLEKCSVGDGLAWVVEFRSESGSVSYRSDGKVIIGPDGFCGSAEKLRSLDIIDLSREFLNHSVE